MPAEPSRVIWRLCQARWAKTAFSGEGAAQYPGRWNSEGVRLVYCAESRALACLELLAHVEDKVLLARADFVTIPVTIAEAAIGTLPRLPRGWDALPPSEASRRVGDLFVEKGGTVGLRVPSLMVRGEFNIILNPLHPRFSDLSVGKPEPFLFDPRLAR